jgi:serine/threonine-protein phosphatase 5
MTYKLFEDAFCALPIATVVSASQAPRPVERRDTRFPVNPILSRRGLKRYYIVHGGLYSKDGVKLEDIKKIDRLAMRQPGTFGLMSESLWADPQELPGRGPSKRVSLSRKQMLLYTMLITGFLPRVLVSVLGAMSPGASSKITM